MRKQDVKTKEDIELYYKKARKIKFDDKIKINNIGDLYNEVALKCRQTFFVRNEEHCQQGRSRSFNDLILLFRYYFPDKSLKYFFNELKSHLNIIEGQSNQMTRKSLYYCGTIKKYNFRYAPYTPNNVFTMNHEHFKGQGFRNCNVKFSEFLD